MRRYPDRPILGVGAIVFDDERVLLVKRAHEPLKGEWSLPGGAVDVGESLAVAAVREVLEETSLEVEAGPIVEVVERVTRDTDGRIEYHFVIVDFLCWRRGGELASASDAADATWAPLHDLDRYHLTTAARDVIRKATGMREDATRADCSPGPGAR